MADAIQKTRIYIWLSGDELLKLNEEDQLMGLLSDIIGGAYHISRMKFNYTFEDGDDVGCLEIRLRSHLTIDDANNIANTIKHSTNLCKGKYEKFKSWFKSAQAFTRMPAARRYCFVDKEQI
jgi:hypothetical protein